MAHLILYDGQCGLCNRLILFVLKRDNRDNFLFAPLQGSTARAILQRHARRSADLDTVSVLMNYGEVPEILLDKGPAVLFILAALGGLWRWTKIFRLLPQSLINRFYDWIANRRYKWFGHYDSCPMPEARYRRKLIE